MDRDAAAGGGLHVKLAAAYACAVTNGQDNAEERLDAMAWKGATLALLAERKEGGLVCRRRQDGQTADPVVYISNSTLASALLQAWGEMKV